MKVNLPKNASVETQELNLLMKVLESSLDKMTKEEQTELFSSLDLKVSNLNKQIIMASLQSAIVSGGFKSYQIGVIVANSISKALVGQGLSFAANSTLTRGLAVFAGPIGWTLTVGITAISLAGPAKRVTIPATIYIASLRQAELYRVNNSFCRSLWSKALAFLAKPKKINL